MSKFVLIAAISGFLVYGVAHAQITPASPEYKRLAAPTGVYSVAPSYPCEIPGHPQAVCWWSDPAAQECFPNPAVSPKGYPARHLFSGSTVCWGGDERFFLVMGKVARP